MTTSPFTKTITFDRDSKDYRMELDGRLIGYARSHQEATTTLNQVVRDMLTHGDCATASELDDGQCSGFGCVDGCIDCISADLVSADSGPFADPRSEDEKRESVEGWIEFAPCEGYPFGGWKKEHVHPFDDSRTVWVAKPRLFATPEPQLVNWNSATAQADDTPPGNDCPDHGPYADDECPKCYVGQRFEHLAFGTGTVIAITSDEHLNVQVKFDSPSRYGSKFWFDRSEVVRPLAQTLQSRAIEAKLTTCAYCAGIHHIQICPSLRAALRADVWQGADLGRGLCQMRWRNPHGFVALLLSVTPQRLLEYALSYQAFIKANTPDSDLTMNDVLVSWRRAMQGDRGPAAMSVAA